MIKAVVVKNNKVKKIVVTKDPADVKLFENEELKPFPKNKKLQVGGNYDGPWTLFLKKLGFN